MLILTRKAGEKIICTAGETQIAIVVTRIGGDRVRLGVEAPKDVVIDREETHWKRTGEQEVAS